MTIQPATPHELQTFLVAEQIAAELITDLGPTPTVPAAALALGVDSAQIIKTLLFLVSHASADEPAPLVVISHGERRVNTKLLATHLGVTKKRINFASPAVVLEQLGYPAGGVPPLGHRQRFPTLLDASVVQAAERFGGTLYGGGGDDQTMLKLQLAELLRVVAPEIVILSD